MAASRRIIALGDSITKGYGVPEGLGWVEIVSRNIENCLGKSLEVINAGGNGNTSREGLQRYATDVLPHLPATVFIEFGGNDPVNDRQRHVSPEEFHRNLHTLVKRISAAGGNCVLMTFPVIIDEQHSSYPDPYFQEQGGIDKVVNDYRELTRQCSKEMSLPLIDLDRLTRNWIRCEGLDAIIAADGIHLTVRANELTAEAVLNLLRDAGV